MSQPLMIIPSPIHGGTQNAQGIYLISRSLPYHSCRFWTTNNVIKKFRFRLWKWGISECRG